VPSSVRRPSNSAARRHFDQAIEDLRWAWEHFRDDPLARDICWRFPVAADAVCHELAGGFGGSPIPRALLTQMCERGIEAAQLLGDNRLRDDIQCALASRAGALKLEVGDAAQAARFLAFALSLAQDLRNEKLLGRILAAQAEMHLIQQDWQAAKTAFLRSADLAQKTDDTPGAAVAVFGLGKACRVMGERLEAAEWLRNALQQSRDLALPDLESKVIQELGVLWMSLGEYAAAIRCYEEAILGAADALARGQARLALGEAYLAAGSISRAGQLFQEAESDARLSGDRITLDRVLSRRDEIRAEGTSAGRTDR